MFNAENLKPVMQSPLHHFELNKNAKAITDSCGVWANELPLLGYISVRGSLKNKSFIDAFKLATRLALPNTPCSSAKSEWGTIYWLSIDEWLIVCHRDRHQGLLQALQSALSGIHSQVVDNAGGYTTVVLKGRNATEALHHCTVYDLAALTSGRVVGTTFGKTNIILSKVEDGYVLLLRRSFADYIWQYLERSAAPYGFGIAVLEGKVFP